MQLSQYSSCLKTSSTRKEHSIDPKEKQFTVIVVFFLSRLIFNPMNVSGCIPSSRNTLCILVQFYNNQIQSSWKQLARIYSLYPSRVVSVLDVSRGRVCVWSCVRFAGYVRPSGCVRTAGWGYVHGAVRWWVCPWRRVRVHLCCWVALVSVRGPLRRAGRG